MPSAAAKAKKAAKQAKRKGGKKAPEKLVRPRPSLRALRAPRPPSLSAWSAAAMLSWRRSLATAGGWGGSFDGGGGWGLGLTVPPLQLRS